MGKISLTHNVEKLKASIKKKERAISKLVSTEVQKEGSRTHADLVKSTPRKWSGNTRKAWKVKRLSKSYLKPHVRVHNDEPVMFWLEEGTGRRYPKRAKNLFIPLRHSAWKAGGYKQGMKWGKDFVFAKSARGIKALKLLPKQMPVTIGRLKAAMKSIAKL